MHKTVKKPMDSDKLGDMGIKLSVPLERSLKMALSKDLQYWEVV